MDLYYISFYCFSNIINIFYYLFIIYCVSNTISPVRTQNFLIDAGWATVRLYHCGKSKTIKFFKQQLEKYMNDDIKQIFCKKDELQFERTFYVKDGIETNCLLNDSDMVLTFLNNVQTSDNTIPVLRLKEADSFSTALVDNKFCSYKFITIILIPDKNNKKQSISIDLSKPFNYYLDSNIILDYTFIKWYGKKYHNLDINRSDYALEIFDQNAQYLYLTSENEIILNKDDYVLNTLSTSNTYENIKNKVNEINEVNDYDEADKVDSDNDNNVLKHRKSIDINLEN